MAFGGALLLWAAFPPLGWWPLAWLAPLPWLALVDRERLTGRAPYFVLWAAGFVHWLLLLQGIRLAHWATYFGWVALAMYLGVYLPLFIGLARLAVRRLRWSVLLAAPVIWTGLELLRGYLLTGFSLALLGHTQVDLLPVIQIADLGGAYAVSFVVMLVAACLWRAGRGLASHWKERAGHLGDGAGGERWAGWARVLVPLAVTAGGLALVLGYGFVRLRGPGAEASGATIEVALIQSSAPTVFEYNPQRNLEVFQDYRELSLAAAREHPELDLIVWPESVYTANIREVRVTGRTEPPAAWEMGREEFERVVAQWRRAFEAKNTHLAESINGLAWETTGKRGTASLLVGTDVEEMRAGASDIYNTALLLDDQGQVSGRYYKMHPVMFGEYVPLGRWVPWLYDLTPLSQGLTPGQRPECFEVKGVKLSPSICFESTVPHLIRRHVRRLANRGETPDVLVSVTNDGWFHGSSILDLHLACGVFRAVENRCPLLVAANTGISAHVDAEGRVRQQLPALGEGFLVCQVGADPRWSLYTRAGDLFPLACLLATAAVPLVVLSRRSKPRESRE